MVVVSKYSEEWLAVRLEAPFTRELLDQVRSIPGRRWLDVKKVWLIPYTYLHVEKLMAVFQSESVEVQTLLLQECEPLRTWVRCRSDWNSRLKDKLKLELQARGYSSKTLKTYLSQIERFFRYVAEQESEVNSQMVKPYSTLLLQSGKCLCESSDQCSEVLFSSCTGMVGGRYFLCETEKGTKAPGNSFSR